MLLPLLLLGCASHDGTWLLTLTLKEDTSGSGTTGVSYDYTGTLSELSDGGAALDLGGLVLPGTISEIGRAHV
jgi:hypothetical protein